MGRKRLSGIESAMRNNNIVIIIALAIIVVGVFV